MNTIKLFIALALLSTVLCADDYSDVLKAIDAMIAQEEQKKHFMAHLSDIDHSHDAPLPHDLAYSPEYSVKDLTDGIAYVSALRGAGKPKTPIFTDKDKSDFARADVPSQKLSQQEGLHQTLLQNTNLLNNPQKENELKKSTLNSLIEEEQHLQNPLHDIPVFNTTQTPKNFVLECTLDMENGVPCPGGKCFNGKCKPDQPCYDDCCDSKKFALPDGAPCKGGNCLRGRCRAFPLCIGECCESSLPKPNGTPCTQGHCFEGGCVSDVGCVSGVCCNTYTGRLFPKGFPCHVSDCQQKSFCNGVSSYCPETAPKEDGSICVGGTCNKGVCALSGVVSTTNEICSSGVCCNNSTHTYKPAGTPCSNNPCMTGGACTGYSSECSASFKAVADGTECPGGKCSNGVCVAKATCSSTSECCKNGIMKPDYSVCNHGRCFAGECVIDAPCVGECCKPREGTAALQPRPNGYPCNNNTQVCQEGFCMSVPICVGECCGASGAAENGKTCGNNGKCNNGICEEQKTCKEGVCCNVQKGILRPKGFPCKANPCTKEMECTGTSEYCPISVLTVADGTPCPAGGKCFGGNCVLPPKNVPQCTDGPCCDIKTMKFKPAGIPCGNATCFEPTYCTGSSQYCPATLNTLPDGTVCKLTEKPATDWKCEKGVCIEPPPLPQDLVVDIDLTRNECHVDSPCCNQAINRVRPKGFVCSVAQNSCMKDTYCDGETAVCTPTILEDGAACPGGSCVHGFCIKGIDPTDQDAVHEVHIHVVPKEKHELSPEEAAIQALAEDDDEEEDSDSMEELMTIITKEANGEVTERSMRIPRNALEKAKKKSLQMSTESAKKNDSKSKTREEQVEAAARALIAQEKNATLAQNATLIQNATVAQNATLVQNATVAQNATIAKKPTADNNTLSKTLEAFSVEVPMPRLGEIDPLTGEIRIATSPRCSEGACCDLSRGVYFSRGFQCDVPKNLCKVAACSGYSDKCFTMNRPDGTVCPGGQCYEGECIAKCVGECCDHQHMPRPDGVACNENGFCFEGTCVHKCEDECCNEFGFAKEDGASCTNGFCLEGKCLKTRDDMKQEAVEEAIAEGIDPEDSQAMRGIITKLNKVKPHNMQEEWEKMMKKEEEEKRQEKLEKMREENEEKERNDKIEAAKSVSLKAVTDTAKANEETVERKNALMKKLMIGMGIGVACLALIAIIVGIVASSRKQKQVQEQEEYYDKF